MIRVGLWLAKMRGGFGQGRYHRLRFYFACYDSRSLDEWSCLMPYGS